jgi:hypothetical protein
MDLATLNWLAIIVSGVAYFFLGALWYSPLLLGKLFLRYRGEIGEGGQPIEYLLTLVNGLVAAAVLAIIVRLADAATLVDGLGMGLLVAVGFVLTTSLTFTIFSGPHKMLWVIYSGYKLVGFVLMGVILTLWR